MYKVAKKFLTRSPVKQDLREGSNADLEVWGRTKKQKIHARAQLEKDIGERRSGISRGGGPKRLSPNASLAAAVNALSLAESRLIALSKDAVATDLERQILVALVEDLNEVERASKCGKSKPSWHGFTEQCINRLIDRDDMSLNRGAFNGNALVVVANCHEDLKQRWESFGPEVDLHAATQSAMLKVINQRNSVNISAVHGEFLRGVNANLEKYPRRMEGLWQKTYGPIFEKHQEKFDKIMSMQDDSEARKAAYLKEMSLLEREVLAVDAEALHKMKIAWDGRSAF